MYHDLRGVFWWDDFKKGIEEFVAKCLNCQQVKAEHQKPGDLLQVPTWKCEETNMDFIVDLPQTQRKNESIWVVVDRLTKSAYYIPVKSTYST